MKKLMLSAGSVLALSLVFMSCSKDVESRIARLEGRVAELEAGDGAPRATTPAAAAANSVASVTESVGTGPFPAFAFNESLHDFGTIKEGDVVNHTFSFTNTGEAPLIISSATASCGCTVPQWPKEPIAVGATSEIEVSFNSKSKPGIQNKTITITANTNPKTTRLNIKANVSPNSGPA